MHTSANSRWVALAMLFVFPVTTMAAGTDGAVLRASGPAMLNGIGISGRAAVRPGDLVAAGSGASISLTANGNSVVLPANSRLKYDGRSISLESGHALVTTSNGMKASVEILSVEPTSSSARYEVVKKDGKIIVAALNGTLKLSDGLNSEILSEGYMTTFDSQDDPRVPQPGARKDRERGAFWLNRRRALILLGSAAITAGILYWLLADSPEPISGQNPNQAPPQP